MIRNVEWARRNRASLSAILIAACVLLASGVASADETDDSAGWKGDLALAITAQSGSVDTFAGTLEAGIERDWTDDHVDVRFVGVYGTTRDRKNDPADRPSNDRTVQDSQGLFGSWKHIIHNRFFWNSHSELSRDSTQDREVRFRLATGPGYRFWQGEDPASTHFDVSAGLGYRYELYDGNTFGLSTDPVLGPPAVFLDPDLNGSDQQLADVILAFEYKNNLFEDRVVWSHTGSIAMPVNKTDAYIFTTEAIAAVPFSEAWSFRTGVFYEYVNNVPEDINPSTLRVTVGLGYNF